MLVHSPHPSSYMPPNLPTSCDEEPADEADEPDDLLLASLSDGDFTKHHLFTPFLPLPHESLLTRALLTSPILGPAAAPPFGRASGMSAESVWSSTSAASTADLTSDAGMTSPERANTPSPPPSDFLSSKIAGILHANKDDASRHVDGLGRKRCITFACNGPSRRPSQDDLPKDDLPPSDNSSSHNPAPAKKNSALTFVCTQRTDSDKPRDCSFRLPPPASGHIGFAAIASRPARAAPAQPSSAAASAAAAAAAAPAPSAQLAPFPALAEPRKLYDSESAADSWTNQPIDKTRLLRVDDVLRKEKHIRKLSEEAEAEALQEEGEDGDGQDDADNKDDEDDEDEDEDKDDLEDDDDDDEDDDEDEDDDDEDDDDDDDGDDDLMAHHDVYYGSGNETDNEEGFADDDESDDDGFYGLHPPMILPPRQYHHHHSPFTPSSPRPIRPSALELPDSTDFVCGTLDEDKPLEEAYLSCLEERKRSKHKTTPQDIDPSFPTSEPEDSDHEPGPRHKGPDSSSDASRASRVSRGRTQQSRRHSPRGRVHSPAPVRRTNPAHSPPAPTTTATARAKHAAEPPLPPPPPPPTVSRRNSRALSPAPLPPPPSRRRGASQFFTRNPIVRSRSLPRNPGFARRKTFNKLHLAAGEPPQKATRPMLIRGAIDIVKGLEKKRERRKARLGRKERDRDEPNWRAGEGVEKMRELGLEICGQGRSRPIWVISA